MVLLNNLKKALKHWTTVNTMATFGPVKNEAVHRIIYWFHNAKCSQHCETHLLFNHWFCLAKMSCQSAIESKCQVYWCNPSALLHSWLRSMLNSEWKYEYDLCDLGWLDQWAVRHTTNQSVIRVKVHHGIYIVCC